MSLNAEEQVVMDMIVESADKIRGWGLRANDAELVQAVHVLQSFVVQHMLQRTEPGQWGEWFRPRN